MGGEVAETEVKFEREGVPVEAEFEVDFEEDAAGPVADLIPIAGAETTFDGGMVFTIEFTIAAEAFMTSSTDIKAATVSSTVTSGSSGGDSASVSGAGSEADSWIITGDALH